MRRKETLIRWRFKTLKKELCAKIGDKIDVHDWGICKIVRRGTKDSVFVSLVIEEDNSITWYLNPEFNSDLIIRQCHAKYIKER